MSFVVLYRLEFSEQLLSICCIDLALTKVDQQLTNHGSGMEFQVLVFDKTILKSFVFYALSN